MLDQGRCRWITGVLALFFSGWAVLALAASDELRKIVANPSISSENLQQYVVPLTAEELSELTGIWQQHLSGSLEEFIVLNEGLEGLDEAQAKKQRTKITDFSNEIERYTDNYQIVLFAWQSKGASPEELTVHQTYLDSTRRASLKETDARTLISLVTGWLGSKDGGLGLLLQLAVFVMALIVLLFIARFVRKFAAKGLARVPSISRLLRNFVLTVVYWVTVVLGLMIALGLAGVNVTPLFAVFGGLSFILGFALQDTLGNLASGLMIMVLKPFDTGDYIEVSGASGSVDAMSIVSTQIRTFDNQIIVVPNSKIWGDVITNVSAAKTRRVDLVFGIAYSDSAPQALEVLKRLVAADLRCLKDPSAEIFVGELGESSVNLFCRPWVATDDYWQVYWDLTGQVKEAFDKEGISIPFPQRDIHLIPAES
ncbi:mechanosensitive ion channel family protein [Phaeobacter gallaeciensis]|uniref:Small-conductance mechanosensitive channel n=1 Tax=Phaeobacter gallaeciensis TaxID=60890 RepID=A0A366X6S5_9RHOB|nr:MULTISPECIES: mechanosensitive ion channel family protein [Roseobacteraceae]MBT8169378.1 mechanosensitive ion channel family protein [Falsiruegeria litorea]RBW60607.1 mechanosensitive ion channel family protein [Phaeobacter gallaeciensis]